MRILYTATGADFCPVLAITAFTPADVRALRELAAALAQQRMDAADLDGLAAGGIRLDLRVGTRDEGVRGAHPAFVCELTRQSWMDVCEMLEPFVVDEPHGYQWLSDVGEVSLLISHDGVW